MDKKFFNGLVVGSVATMVLTLGVVTVTQNSQVVDLKSLSKLNMLTSIIEKRYFGEYTEDDIVDGICAGACFNLDQYSAYLTMEDYEEAIDPDQQFGGIGILSTYNKYTKVYKVSNVYDNSPAAQADIRRNDIIEAVDGVDVYGIDLDTISDLIRGEPGTTVTLKICRDDELMDVELVREYIEVPRCNAYGLSEDIGFIKIQSFDGTVVDDFKECLNSVSGAKGLIIDLRGNTGGIVDCYRDIMTQLLPSGVLQTIVYKDGHREDLVCESELNSVKYKIVVLVDDSTASCSEAMAQALKDQAGAIIVGTETYGKGVAQQYFNVDKNSVIRLTVGYVESPSGYVWNELGITPDIELEYEYLGNDFEESILMCDNQVLAAYNALVAEIS